MFHVGDEFLLHLPATLGIGGAQDGRGVPGGQYPFGARKCHSHTALFCDAKFPAKEGLGGRRSQTDDEGRRDRRAIVSRFELRSAMTCRQASNLSPPPALPWLVSPANDNTAPSRTRELVVETLGMCSCFLVQFIWSSYLLSQMQVF